ncbi:MAG: hypothetical protein LCH46_07280 [Proteobacteria bacterium]|nr:hypothetical protein [Pseudomonadota bacterium]
MTDKPASGLPLDPSNLEFLDGLLRAEVTAFWRAIAVIPEDIPASSHNDFIRQARVRSEGVALEIARLIPENDPRGFDLRSRALFWAGGEKPTVTH